MFASFNCVHFRYLGSGDLRFRFYSGLLWKSPKVTKGLLPLTFGASPRLGIPSLRSCSVDPPPSAIHGRRRLTRHPCRVAHCAEPPLGLSRGQEDQKQKQKRRTPSALHHSTGRALARLQLLILIHPPPREAEWRCSSGDWRAAPFDAVEPIACRSKRSRPEGNAPG